MRSRIYILKKNLYFYIYREDGYQSILRTLIRLIIKGDGLMKMFRVIMAASLLSISVSSQASDRVGLSPDVEGALEQYGLLRSQTLVQVTRDHCVTEADEKINSPRYQQGFQAAQNIIFQTNVHFKELYNRCRDENQKAYLEASIVSPASAAYITLPHEPSEYGSDQNPTSVEREGKFSRSREELNIIALYANYVSSEFASIKSLELTGTSEIDPRIINLKNNIKDETYVWVMTLSFVDSTVKGLQNLYENALENSHAYNHLNKNKEHMDSKNAELLAENLKKKELAIKENLDAIDNIVTLFPEIFKAPMGIHKGWCDSFWRGISAYTKADRSSLLKEKFLPLLRESSIDAATTQCMQGIWTKTRLMEKTVPTQYWRYFRDILAIAFSKTKKFESMLPTFSNYRDSDAPLTFKQENTEIKN